MTALDLWLFGIIMGAIGVCILAGASFAFLISNRVTRLETAFEFWSSAMERLGLRAAKALHSPDDHLGIDKLLDQYTDHHHEMTYDQWVMLANVMDEVIDRKDVDKEKKFMAQFLRELASHKMMIKP